MRTIESACDTSDAVFDRVLAGPVSLWELRGFSRAPSVCKRVDAALAPLLASGAIRRVNFDRECYYVAAGWKFGGAEAVRRLKDRCRIDEGGCWVWTGHLSPQGNPTFWMDGKRLDARREAHKAVGNRLTMSVALSPVVCGNPRCICPDHQERITRSEWSGGRKALTPTRSAAIERQRSASKIGSIEAARAIRASGRPSGEEAAKWGVSRQTISLIRLNRIWREPVASPWDGLARKAA